MKSLTQFELNKISAGINQGYGSFSNSGHKNQPQAGMKEDIAIEVVKTVVVLAVTALWTVIFGTKSDNKKEDDKSANYGRYSSSAPF